jgi:hypothetical protein
MHMCKDDDRVSLVFVLAVCEKMTQGGINCVYVGGCGWGVQDFGPCL